MKPGITSSNIEALKRNASVHQVDVLLPKFEMESHLCVKDVLSEMGVKSAFTFGNGFGHIEMALTAAAIPFERVRPQVWQKALGCLTKGDKNITKQKAQEMFPIVKITHAIADALLIAEYNRRTNR